MPSTLGAWTRLALAAVAGGKVDAITCSVCRTTPDLHEAIDHPLRGHTDPFRLALDPLDTPYHRCRECGSVYELVSHVYEDLISANDSEDCYTYRRVSAEAARAASAQTV